MIEIIKPDWPAPTSVHACTTLRMGGYSEAPFNALNMSVNAGDNLENVLSNRFLVMEALSLPSEPTWLKQVHDNRVICLDGFNDSNEADGSFAKTPNKVCVVLTADCLPVLITNRSGSFVCALHAGWRGLARGIIAQAIKALKRGDDELLVWLGPAIGPKAFEVGPEVRDEFLQLDPDLNSAFTQSVGDRWLADIYAIARTQLTKLGIDQIYSGNYCTYSDPKRFYSYRRDKIKAAMASMIWMTPGY